MRLNHDEIIKHDRSYINIEQIVASITYICLSLLYISVIIWSNSGFFRLNILFGYTMIALIGSLALLTLAFPILIHIQSYLLYIFTDDKLILKNKFLIIPYKKIISLHEIKNIYIIGLEDKGKSFITPCYPGGRWITIIDNNRFFNMFIPHKALVNLVNIISLEKLQNVDQREYSLLQKKIKLSYKRLHRNPLFDVPKVL